MSSKIPSFAPVEALPHECQRLRDAIIELNFRHEFAKLELAQVLSEAEISKETFDRLFSGLEDCYCEIYVVERDRIMEEIYAASDQYTAGATGFAPARTRSGER